MRFRLDPNFKREFTRDAQRQVDDVYRRYANRPVAEVRRALKRIGLTESEAAPIATAISEGTRIKIEL